MSSFRYTATAKAPGSVANQPGFDLGGFALKVHRVIAGHSPSWEDLHDTVVIHLEAKKVDPKETVKTLKTLISIQNRIEELEEDENKDLNPLTISVEQHTAGRIVLETLQFFENDLLKAGISELQLQIQVSKGLSIRGTGLGSSGATPAAALKALLALLKKLHIVTSKLDREEISRMLQRSDFGVPDNATASFFGGLNIFQLSDNNEVASLERIEAPADLLYVLATPKGFGIVTKTAREVLQGLSAPEENSSLTSEALGALRSGDLQRYSERIEQIHAWFVGSILDESGLRDRRSSLYPGSGRLFTSVERAAKKAGAWGLTISGSGPTMIAFVPNEKTAELVGQAMYDAFEAGGYAAVTRLCSVSSEGAFILE